MPVALGCTLPYALVCGADNHTGRSEAVDGLAGCAP
jgi:hypothetical protein